MALVVLAVSCASDQNAATGQARPTATARALATPVAAAVATPLPTAVIADEPAVPPVPEPTPTRVPWGVVVDEAGAPVAEAQVIIQRLDELTAEFESVGNTVYVSSETRGRAFTNDAGEFSWGVLPGTYRVAASARGCVSADDDSDVAFSDTREVPPAALNLVVNLDCTARGFGDFELRIHLLAGSALGAPVFVDVLCVRDGQVEFEQTVEWVDTLVVERLPLETVCTAEVVGDSENFRLLDEAVRSVTISSIHTNPIEFVGVTGSVLDEIVVSLFVREELPDMTVKVGFTARCDNGLVDSFELSPGDSHTIEPLFIGDGCEIAVDQPSIFEMEEDTVRSVALGLVFAEPPRDETDDVYFVLLSAP